MTEDRGSLNPQPLPASGGGAGAPSATPAPAAAAEPNLVGQVLDGRYQVMQKLGEGALSVVYEARHSGSGRHFAIKVLRASFAAKPNAVDLFLQQARAAANIRHKNVLTIEEFGYTPSRSVYAAVELAVGQTLASIVAKDGKWPWERARPVAQQMAAALGAAHQANVVHRAFKPANCFVFLDPRGKRAPLVKVADFGMARVGVESSQAAPGATTTTMFGDPEYMAPEQGFGGQPIIGWDIYAFGVVLYRMLTGAVPFSNPNAFQVISQHAQKPTPPLRQVDPSIPEMVEQIVMRCLAKAPEQRFANGAEIERALEATPGAPAAQAAAAAAGGRPPRFAKISTGGAEPGGGPQPTPSKQPSVIVAGSLGNEGQGGGDVPFPAPSPAPAPGLAPPPSAPGGVQPSSPSAFMASRPGLRMGLGASVDDPSFPATIAPGSAIAAPTVAPGMGFGPPSLAPPPSLGGGPGLPPLGAGPGLPPAGAGPGLPPPSGGSGLPPLGAGPGLPSPIGSPSPGGGPPPGSGLPPIGAGPGLPPIGGGAGLPSPGLPPPGGGLPPIGSGPGLPPIGAGPGLPPIGAGAGLPPPGAGAGLPPIGAGPGLPPIGAGPGLPPPRAGSGAGPGYPPAGGASPYPPSGLGSSPYPSSGGSSPYPPSGGGGGLPPLGAGPGMPALAAGPGMPQPSAPGPGDGLKRGIGAGMPPVPGGGSGAGLGGGGLRRPPGPGIPPRPDPSGPNAVVASSPSRVEPPTLTTEHVEYDDDQPKRRPLMFVGIAVGVVLLALGIGWFIVSDLEADDGDVAQVTRAQKGPEVDYDPNEPEAPPEPEEDDDELPLPVVKKKPPKPVMTFERSLAAMKGQIRNSCAKVGKGPVELNTMALKTGGSAIAPTIKPKGPVGDCARRIVEKWSFPASDKDHQIQGLVHFK